MNDITTFAGSGTAGYIGDNGPATTAQVRQPDGLAVDGQSNLYIADTGNDVIREVNGCTGTITTVAGTGSPGFGADGHAATATELDAPGAIAVDSSSNIYIADTMNNAVRLVTHSTGNISTIAGTGPKTPGNSGDGGTATSAYLNQPNGIAVDTYGNVYIADTQNNRIRKITGTTITNYAGNSAGLPGFSGDNGPATQAKLNQPYQLAIGPNNDLYIADFLNARIRKVSYSTQIITTVAGGGTMKGDGISAISASLGLPFGVGVDSLGNVYIATAGDSKVREVTNANIYTFAGTGTQGSTGDGGLATAATVNFPNAVVVDAEKNVYICDTNSQRIRVVVQ